MGDKAGTRRIREALQPLALQESDLQDGDSVVRKIADLKAAIEALDPGFEPWVKEWLTDEHYKGAVLYAAAKTNWKRDKQGTSDFADRQTRAQIISRFNSWVDQLLTRLTQYDSGPRDAESVKEWRSRIALFKQDPVRND